MFEVYTRRELVQKVNALQAELARVKADRAKELELSVALARMEEQAKLEEHIQGLVTQRDKLVSIVAMRTAGQSEG